MQILSGDRTYPGAILGAGAFGDLLSKNMVGRYKMSRRGLPRVIPKQFRNQSWSNRSRTGA